MTKVLKRLIHRFLGYKVLIYSTARANRNIVYARCWLGSDGIVRAWWRNRIQVALLSDGTVAGLPTDWKAVWEPVESKKRTDNFMISS